jgi:hypothetical protein
VSATARLFERGLGPGQPLRVLAASGQLGYGVPEAALNAGVARDPHFIGCDMGSIDVGPYYLGAGKLATTELMTKRDLRLVLRAALGLGVPLLIGTAGTSGAVPHVAQTRSFIHEIAKEDGLTFRMATIHADMPRQLLHEMVAAGRTRPLGKIAALDAVSHWLSSTPMIGTVQRRDRLFGDCQPVAATDSDHSTTPASRCGHPR